MEVHKSNWTINLGGPTRGADINKEIAISKLKVGLDAAMDAYKAGDNAEYRIPVSNVKDHVLVGKDLDSQQGRVLVDLASGHFEAKEKGGYTNPYYTNDSKLKAAVEFDPATGQSLRYSGTNGVMNFDITYKSGQLSEIATGSADGSYRETVTFSENGKTVTFNSEQQVEDPKDAAKDRAWFLSLG
jgi:hypothetical protein